MMFLWLPLLFLIPFAFVRMVRPEVAPCSSTDPYRRPASGPADADPLDIARLRLARGEITPTEYEQIRRLIG